MPESFKVHRHTFLEEMTRFGFQKKKLCQKNIFKNFMSKKVKNFRNFFFRPDLNFSVQNLICKNIQLHILHDFGRDEEKQSCLKKDF